MTDETAGLRERKKQRTRDAIVREAMALFGERGFDATTIADIAERADIAPRTFFAYFASKEDVVFHDFDAFFTSFESRLRDRAAGETAFDALRAWIAGWLEEADLAGEEHRARHRLVRSTPALQAHDRANLARFEAALAEGVAADLGVAPDSPRAHLVSSAATAALDALDRVDDDAEPRDADQALAVVDEALVFLQAGLGALRRHPPAR